MRQANLAKHIRLSCSAFAKFESCVSHNGKSRVAQANLNTAKFKSFESFESFSDSSESFESFESFEFFEFFWIPQ
jgi:hypothetical protein